MIRRVAQSQGRTCDLRISVISTLGARPQASPSGDPSLGADVAECIGERRLRGAANDADVDAARRVGRRDDYELGAGRATEGRGEAAERHLAEAVEAGAP